MGQPISLFSGYSQKENRTTNYCLLILKMLYEANQSYFAEVISGLIGYDISSHVGVTFKQQERKISSVPDGLISQKPFSIYIETKNYDWFYDEQLENHLESLNKETSGIKILIALGNFESLDEGRFAKIKGICEDRHRNSIIFSAVTFEDFISALNIHDLPKYIQDARSELQQYLDEEQLLPTWKNTLDVINCAGLPDDVLVHGIYMCPALTGAYSHRRCRFFGMYQQKKVSHVAEIHAVFDVYDASSADLLWRNVKRPLREMRAVALEKVFALRSDEYPVRIFILGGLYETNFIKDTPGGLMGSKTYFDISRFHPDDPEELATSLTDLSWTELY